VGKGPVGERMEFPPTSRPSCVAPEGKAAKLPKLPLISQWFYAHTAQAGD